MCKYLSEMKALGTELAKTVLPHDKSAIADDLIKLERAGWQVWFDRHYEEILEYMGYQPSIRKKKWGKDIQNLRRVVLGALVLHRAAIVFQDAWEQHNTHIGLSYRDAHKEAAYFGWKLATDFEQSRFVFPLDQLHIYELIADGAYYGHAPSWPPFFLDAFTDLLIPKKRFVQAN